jgi:hypothetical protein
VKRIKIVGAVAALFCFVACPLAVVLGGPGVAGGSVHDGQPVDCDVPEALRIKNVGGSDGAGLCVFASLEMAANYQNERAVMGTFDWMKSQPGGGWPERVDEIMKTRAPGVKYRQYLGTSLDFIRQGIDSGRPVCVTYGYGEFYNMQTIYHMVICVGMTDKYAAILDNNDPSKIWWMDTAEFQKRFTHPDGQGWAYYIMSPPPPPIPIN